MWGKIVGAMAGFAMGGPLGAMVGAALGHAAENGGIGTGFTKFQFNAGNPRIAALPRQRDQVFALGVVVLAARLAKCDGSVNRAEIDAFKRHFRVPPGSEGDVGRLFDQARDGTEPFLPYASRMGLVFADNSFVLEDVLSALFSIARADAPINRTEDAFLREVHAAFALGEPSWDRARRQLGDQHRHARTATRGAHRGAGVEAEPADPQHGRADDGEDPYAVLGVSRDLQPDELRATWKRLMREHHPDSLASRGVPEAFIRSAGEKVARINAAWDRIKRERGL